MNNEVKLRFKGYELPYNPKRFQLKRERHILKINSPLSGSVLQDLGFHAAVLTGDGCFYGMNGQAEYDRLFALFQTAESGLLHSPGQKPFHAYFTALSAARTAGPDVLTYHFEFVEDCQKSRGGGRL